MWCLSLSAASVVLTSTEQIVLHSVKAPMMSPLRHYVAPVVCIYLSQDTVADVVRHKVIGQYGIVQIDWQIANSDTDDLDRSFESSAV